MDTKSVILIAKLTQDSKWNKYIQTKTALPYVFLLYSYGVFLMDESSIPSFKKTQQERLVYDSEIEYIYNIKNGKLLKFSPREFKGVDSINKNKDNFKTNTISQEYFNPIQEFSQESLSTTVPTEGKYQYIVDGVSDNLIYNPIPSFASPIPREIKNDIPAYDFK